MMMAVIPFLLQKVGLQPPSAFDGRMSSISGQHNYDHTAKGGHVESIGMLHQRYYQSEKEGDG